MTDGIVNEAKKDFELATSHLEDELKKVRTGRAHASMLDGIMVDAYGSQMPLVAAGSITVPEPQLLQITPFDPNNIQAISQAIRDDQSLGLNPIDDGRVVRIQIPQLTAERRQQLARQLGEKAEESLIRMRNARHEALKRLKKLEEDKAIGRDDAHRTEKQLDDIMAEMKKRVDSIVEAKEKEVLTV